MIVYDVTVDYEFPPVEGETNRGQKSYIAISDVLDDRLIADVTQLVNGGATEVRVLIQHRGDLVESVA